MPVLTCRRVTFYSLGDELAFDNWLTQIKAITKVVGHNDSILLHIPRRPSNQSLRELLALFFQRPEPWTEHAACRTYFLGKDGRAHRRERDPFFPGHSESLSEGRSICGSCIVKRQCDDYADRTGNKDGMWAGKMRSRRR